MTCLLEVIFIVISGKNKLQNECLKKLQLNSTKKAKRSKPIQRKINFMQHNFNDFKKEMKFKWTKELIEDIIPLKR